MTNILGKLWAGRVCWAPVCNKPKLKHANAMAQRWKSDMTPTLAQVHTDSNRSSEI